MRSATDRFLLRRLWNSGQRQCAERDGGVKTRMPCGAFSGRCGLRGDARGIRSRFSGLSSDFSRHQTRSRDYCRSTGRFRASPAFTEFRRNAAIRPARYQFRGLRRRRCERCLPRNSCAGCTNGNLSRPDGRWRLHRPDVLSARGFAQCSSPLLAPLSSPQLSTPALASGPTPVDVAAFSAAMAGLPSWHELHREQASGDLRGFAAAMRRAMDVATAVAERDYPQLGAGWNACQSHMITRDGGLTYQFEPSYPNRMQSDQRPVAAHRRATQGS
jgi:hypothetical protein